MRAAALVLLALLELSAGSPTRADISAARTLIARCAAIIEPGLRGLDALRDACPGIEEALGQLGIEPLLPSDWRQQLSPRALGDFAALDSRYTDLAALGNLQPDVARLRSIALDLRPPPVPLSWWERLFAWARHWLERNAGDQSSWLRFLPHLKIGPGLMRILFVALVLLVVVSAAAVVIVEIRAAETGRGRLARWLVRRPSADPASTTLPSQGLSDLGDLDSVPARDRPVLLLRSLVQALVRSHRLRRDKDLTCRELVVEAHFDTARQREDFRRVALLAERALYGEARAGPPVIPDELLLRARILDEQLRAAPAATEAV